MDLKKYIYISNIVRCMETLVLKLDDKSSAFRSSISNIVKCVLVDNNLIELNYSELQIELSNMYTYIFSAREKSKKTKEHYINKVYVMIGEVCINSLIMLSDILQNICKLIESDGEYMDQFLLFGK